MGGWLAGWRDELEIGQTRILVYLPDEGLALSRSFASYCPSRDSRKGLKTYASGKCCSGERLTHVDPWFLVIQQASTYDGITHGGKSLAASEQNDWQRSQIAAALLMAVCQASFLDEESIKLLQEHIHNWLEGVFVDHTSRAQYWRQCVITILEGVEALYDLVEAAVASEEDHQDTEEEDDQANVDNLLQHEPSLTRIASPTIRQRVEQAPESSLRGARTLLPGG